jgi:ribosomal protein S18 acetylase RimI-like enzyme
VTGVIADVTIRQAEAADLADLLELYGDLHDHDEPAPAGTRRDELWHAMLHQPGLRCVVADREGRLVASYVLAIVPNLTRGGRSFAVIENVVTRRDSRQRGIGSAMMRHALATAWAEDCYKVMLQSATHRFEAHRFYERCGFRSDQKKAFVAYPPAGAEQHGGPSAAR